MPLKKLIKNIICRRFHTFISFQKKSFVILLYKQKVISDDLKYYSEIRHSSVTKVSQDYCETMSIVDPYDEIIFIRPGFLTPNI